MVQYSDGGDDNVDYRGLYFLVVLMIEMLMTWGFVGVSSSGGGSDNSDYLQLTLCL